MPRRTALPSIPSRRLARRSAELYRTLRTRARASFDASAPIGGLTLPADLVEGNCEHIATIFETTTKAVPNEKWCQTPFSE